MKIISNMQVVNIGVAAFADGMREQAVPVHQIDWRPPADAKLLRRLKRAENSGLLEKIEAANQRAVDAMLDAEPIFIGIRRVIDVVPGIKPNMILHSGPPIAWEDMIPAHQRGIIGGVLHEQLAPDRETARDMIESGEILVESANDHFCVGAGIGIITPHMVVNVCRDTKTGLEGYCIPFEGRVGLGVWGVYNEEVEANLQYIENVFAPAVTAALELGGGINVKSIIAKGLQMGDEMHTRQTAGGLLLVNEIVPMLLRAGINLETVVGCIEQFTSTERWFHPVCLAASMAVARAAMDIPFSTIVTNSVQNGVMTGIKVGGTGQSWFLADAPYFVGSYFSSEWGPEDANAYIGDSTVSEVVGTGGFSAAAAPIVLQLRDGGYREAIAQSEEMRLITYAVNNSYPLPLLDFTGPGIGIDIRKVVRTGITPIMHGGIISKQGGQIGAGAARFPIEHYLSALRAFLDRYEEEEST